MTADSGRETGPEKVDFPGLRFLDHTCPTVAEDLALDEALLVAAEEGSGGPVLRVWEPPNLAVVLGASCRRLDDVDVERCRADGVAVARRSSGGGTVLVGPGALNVNVVLPVDAAPGLNSVDAAQAFVLERIARSLRMAGLPVEVKGSGDLTLGGRKFAGSAQRRLRRFFLVHATVLYDLPAATVARYLRPPKKQPDYRDGRSHDDFLTTCPLPRPALVDAVRRAWIPDGAPTDPPPLPSAIVARLTAEKFADPAWVERL